MGIRKIVQQVRDSEITYQLHRSQVDPGLLPDPHPATLSLSLLRSVEIKTGRLLTNYHHEQKRLDLRKIKLIVN